MFLQPIPTQAFTWAFFFFFFLVQLQYSTSNSKIYLHWKLWTSNELIIISACLRQEVQFELKEQTFGDLNVFRKLSHIT